MFDFSETFVTAQIIAGLFIACALFFSGVLKKSSWLAFGWACVICVVVLAALVTLMGGIETLGDPRALIFLLIPLGAVVLALIWAFILRVWPGDRPDFKGGRLVLSVLLALPALVGAGYFYQQQALPQTSCAQSHLPVSIEGMLLNLPLAFHTGLRLEGRSDIVTYSPDARHKETRKTLCALAEDRQGPLPVELVRLAALSYLPDVSQACRAGDQPFCARLKALDATRLGAVQITKPDPSVLSYEMEQMRKPQSDGLEYAGDGQRGYVCQAQTGGLPLRHCRVWRTLEAGAVVLAVGAKTDAAVFAELRAHAEREIEFVLQALAHRAP